MVPVASRGRALVCNAPIHHKRPEHQRARQLRAGRHAPLMVWGSSDQAGGRAPAGNRLLGHRRLVKTSPRRGELRSANTRWTAPGGNRGQGCGVDGI